MTYLPTHLLASSSAKEHPNKMRAFDRYKEKLSLPVSQVATGPLAWGKVETPDRKNEGLVPVQVPEK